MSNGRKKAVARGASRILFWTLLPPLVLVLALVGLLTWGKGAVGGIVTSALEPMFSGRLVVADIEGLTIDRATGVDLLLYDEGGRLVGEAHDVSADLPLFDVVGQIFGGDPRLTIDIERLDVRHLRLDFSSDEEGQLRFVRALEPPQPPDPTKPSQPLTLRMGEIHVKHGWIHGEPAPGLLLDVGVDRTSTSLSLVDDRLALEDVNLKAKARHAAGVDDVLLELAGEAELDIAAEAVLDDSALPAMLTRAIVNLDLSRKDSSATLHASRQGKTVRLEVDASLAASLLAELGLPARPAEVSVEAEGNVRRFESAISVTSDRTVVALDSDVQWGDELQIQGTLDAKEFTLDWIQDQNQASVDAEITFDVARARGSRLDSPSADDPEWAHWKGKLRGQTSSFTYQGSLVPALFVEAEFDPPAFSVDITSPDELDQTEIHVAGELTRDARVPDLSIRAQAQLQQLRSYVPALPEGRGPVEIQGRVSPSQDSVELSLRASLRDVRLKDTASAESLQIEGTISGSLSSPRLDVEANLRKAAVLSGTPQRRDFSEVRATVEGTLDRARVRIEAREKNAKWTVESDLDLSSGVRASDTSVSLTSKDGDIAIQAKSIDLQGSRIAIDDLRLSGMGTGRVSGSFDGSELSIEGTLRDVPVHTLAERLSLDIGGLRGMLDLDADFRTSSGGADGRVRLILAQASIESSEVELSGVPQLDASVDVVGEGTTMLVTYSVEPTSAKRSDAVALEGSLEIRVPPRTKRSQIQAWLDRVMSARASGALELDAVPAELLPEDWDASGRLDVRARLERTDVGAVPDFRVFARTNGLSLVYPVDSALEGQSRGVQTLSLDFRAHVVHEPAKNQTRLWVAVSDQDRSLGHLRVRAETSLARWPIDMAEIGDVPIRAYARFPMTPLSSLPPRLGTTEMRGMVGLRARLAGTLSDPHLVVRARVRDFKRTEVSTSSPLSVRASFDYEGGAASWDIEGSCARSFAADSRCFSLHGSARAPVDLTRGAVDPQAIDLDGEFDEFPLDLFGMESVRGILDGNVVVKGYGTDAPVASTRLDLGRVELSGIQLRRGRLAADLDRDTARLRLQIDDRDYSAQARLEAGLDWESAFVPSLDGSLDGRVSTRRLPLRILRPAVDQSLADLDGTLDMLFEVERGNEGMFVHGSADLKDGKFQLPNLGQQLRDIDATVVWKRDGRIVVEDATFRGITGRGTLDASVRMDGFLPQEGQVRLQVSRRERLPLSIQGLGLGEFWGDVEAKADFGWQERRLDFDVEFHEFQVAFPVIPSGSVQPLAPDEHVSAGAWVNEEDFVELPLQPVELDEKVKDPWTVQATIRLGDDFWAQQGARRRIRIGGELTALVEEEVTLDGQLTLSQGRIDINGRVFEVREGTITMQPGQPDNPIVVAEARWQSPENIVVIARFIGPVKSGEMTLSSEPPLPQGQILSLLLFGDTGGLNGAQDSSDNDSQAIAVGGSVATQGLNRALTRLEAVDISTRINTSDSDAVRPELVIQLTNSVSAQIGYNLEEPSPGQPPDRTIVSLEVRLTGGNSVSATVGDEGSAFFDWVWRYRY